MSPSWYDLLGVPPTASSEEIRAAWKDAIADLDPTDRRFRVLNEAAEVLLDPERRKEYDASLVEVARGTSALETSAASPPIATTDTTRPPLESATRRPASAVTSSSFPITAMRSPPPALEQASTSASPARGS